MSILEQGATANVFHIHPHPIVEPDASATVNLPDTSDSRRYVKSIPLPCFAGIGFIDRQWSWTNQ